MDQWNDEEPYRYSNERRNNAELKEKVKKVVSLRLEAMEQANELLKQARHIMQEAALFGDDPHFMNHLNDISRAGHSLSEETLFRHDIQSDTYIENLAAGRLGEQIENMGDRFPLLDHPEESKE